MALRKIIIITLIWSFGLGFSKIQAQNSIGKSNANQKPNIIFILTDDLGYGDIGIFFQNEYANEKGAVHPREFTPVLDKMGQEGALLTQQYAPAPVCAPSRASLMLGRSQGHSNIRDNQFDKAIDNNHTLASVMRKSGYATAAIGKWGMQGKEGSAPNWTAHPLNRGFDYYLGYMRHGDGHEHYPKEGIYRGAKEVYENRKEISQDLDKCYTGDLWTAAAKKWIVDHKQSIEAEKPFFMFLAYDTPHAVLELPTQAYPKGGGLKGGLQWTGKPGQMINTASGTPDSWMHPDYANATFDDDENASTPEVSWPDVNKRYATSIRRIDNAVGDLIQLLKDLNIDENTMVVFTSDNGPSLESYLKDEPISPTFFSSYGPFDGVKRDCLEGGLRVPTIARWPGHIPVGNVINTPSIFYDWMPTFSDMAGLPAPAISDGISLLPSLLKQGEQTESQIYVEYFQKGKTPGFDKFGVENRGRQRNQMQMIRVGDLVGVRYDIKSQNDNFEIYDVIKDPQQSKDLASTPEMQKMQQHMKDKVLQSRMPNNTALRPYDNALVPAVLESNIKKGVQWKGYFGNFPWVPQVTTLTPAAEGIMDSPNTETKAQNEYDTMYYEGFIRVPKDGDYTFYVTANNSAVLRIHNALVIDADYEYFQNVPKSGEIKLKAGLHPYRLYFNKGDKKKPALKLEWKGPGIAKEKVPASSFFVMKD
ncbi:sulfatase-like hydrolase/transferase [Formosa undariae]|uniref:Sulfatase-like hydrolase/transferase n=1 Tax=Formosa undariae TaxID=1325436 RepID=A0ABV5EZZ4_9FLAO